MLRTALMALTISIAFICHAQKSEDIAPSPDLNGWRVISGEWRVENGELIGKSQSGEAAIALPKKFADFEFECEMNTPTPCAGGVVARAHDLPALPLAEGVNADTAPKHIYGYRLCADTNDFVGTAKFTIESFPEETAQAMMTRILPVAKEWNTLAIHAHGEELRGALNKGAIWKFSSDRFLSGAIILTAGAPAASGPSEVRIRNLRIKDFGREGAWEPLWNGIDFSQFGFFGEEEWRVLDGGIVGTSGKKKSEGYAKTRATFKDFRVRGTYRMFGDGNYGLFYHSTIAYDDKQFPIISGVQGEVAWGQPSSTGCIYESYKRGWLEKPDMTRVGAFAQDMKGLNEIEILAQGNRRATWVNGVKMTDITDPTPNYTEGAFALQLHTGGVSGIMWKDLYVIDLIK